MIMTNTRHAQSTSFATATVAFKFYATDTRMSCDPSKYKLATKRSCLEVRRNFFSQRVVSPWNRLASHVVKATTVNTYKYRVDKLKEGTP